MESFHLLGRLYLVRQQPCCQRWALRVRVQLRAELLDAFPVLLRDTWVGGFVLRGGEKKRFRCEIAGRGLGAAQHWPLRSGPFRERQKWKASGGQEAITIDICVKTQR